MLTRFRSWLAAPLALFILRCAIDDRQLSVVQASDSQSNTSGGTAQADSGGSSTIDARSGDANGGSTEAGQSNPTAGTGGSSTNVGGTDTGSGAEPEFVERTCTGVLASSPVIADFNDWDGDRFGGDGLDGKLSGGVFVYGAPEGQEETTLMTSVEDGTLIISGTVENYSGFGVWLDVRQGDGIWCNDCCLDASDCDGLSFEISGNEGLKLVPDIQGHTAFPREVLMEGDEPRGGCLFSSQDTKYDECQFAEAPGFDVNATPTPVELPFSEFSPGVPAVRGGAQTEMLGLAWALPWTDTMAPYDVEVRLANLRLYGGDACGTADIVAPDNGCAPVVADTFFCDEVTVATGEEPLIEDFEDGDGDLLVGDGRGNTAWWFGDDGYGVSTPDPGTFPVAELEEPRDGSTRAFHTTGTEHTGAASWGALAGVFLAPWLGDDVLSCYDASAYTGVSFWARGNGSVSVTAAMAKTPSVDAGGACECNDDDPDCLCCGNDYNVNLTVTEEWQQYSFYWSDFRNSPEAAQTSFDVAQLTTLTFFLTPPAWDIWIDDISFLTD